MQRINELIPNIILLPPASLNSYLHVKKINLQLLIDLIDIFKSKIKIWPKLIKTVDNK